MPVSYTHLDVYKRQVRLHGWRAASARSTPAQAGRPPQRQPPAVAGARGATRRASRSSTRCITLSNRRSNSGCHSGVRCNWLRASEMRSSRLAAGCSVLCIMTDNAVPRRGRNSRQKTRIYSPRFQAISASSPLATLLTPAERLPPTVCPGIPAPAPSSSVPSYESARCGFH